MSTLHPALLQFFDAVARLCDQKTLYAAARRLCQKYRGDPSAVSCEPEDSVCRLEGMAEHAAYVLCRMPATFSAAKRALEHARAIIPDFSPKTVLDLGSGPGTALFASRMVFPSLQSGLGLEASENFCRLSQMLVPSPGRVIGTDLETPPQETDAVDLLIASYSFGELTQQIQDRWLAYAARQAQVVVLVEPGTPAGWRCLMRCRDQLLALGAHLLAPCPHEKPCPFQGTEAWCHQAIRLPRTATHRKLKGGELGYEDEKFSYLAASFAPDHRSVQPPSRIVHAPRHRRGHSYVELCTPEGVFATRIISRKHKGLYRYVKEAKWGDILPEERP